MSRITDQDRSVAARILPRLMLAVAHVECSEMEEEKRAACVGAMADAYRLLGVLLDELGIEHTP